MLSVMSKYLECHDKDGVVLFYCFIKHFAGATKESIIDAYRHLTESKVQLSLYKNNVSEFTNAIRIPTRQLANCQETPTFQHFLNVYHGILDCPNEEFRLFANDLYGEYRNDGPASKYDTLELLEKLDDEYNHIVALGHWEKDKSKDSEIITLTAEISSLKTLMANLAKVTPGPTVPKGNSNKPTSVPKAGEKETATVNGVLWHYCRMCFGGKGAWNKTHTTEKHVVGAGKGYKGGREKVKNPPTPGCEPALANATANLAMTQENGGAFAGAFLV